MSALFIVLIIFIYIVLASLAGNLIKIKYPDLHSDGDLFNVIVGGLLWPVSLAIFSGYVLTLLPKFFRFFKLKTKKVSFKCSDCKKNSETPNETVKGKEVRFSA